MGDGRTQCIQNDCPESETGELAAAHAGNFKGFQRGIYNDFSRQLHGKSHDRSVDLRNVSFPSEHWERHRSRATVPSQPRTTVVCFHTSVAFSWMVNQPSEALTLESHFLTTHVYKGPLSSCLSSLFSTLNRPPFPKTNL